MTGILDESGHLHINRNGVMKQQLCPQANGSLCCGDWCPKMEEPKGQSLQLCGNTLLYGIEDKRKLGRTGETAPAPAPKAAPEKQGRGRRREKEEPKHWVRVKDLLWACPVCGSERDVSGFTSNKPRFCLHCRERLLPVGRG